MIKERYLKQQLEKKIIKDNDREPKRINLFGKHHVAVIAEEMMKELAQRGFKVVRLSNSDFVEMVYFDTPNTHEWPYKLIDITHRSLRLDNDFSIALRK